MGTGALLDAAKLRTSPHYAARVTRSCFEIHVCWLLQCRSGHTRTKAKKKKQTTNNTTEKAWTQPARSTVIRLPGCKCGPMKWPPRPHPHLAGGGKACIRPRPMARDPRARIGREGERKSGRWQTLSGGCGFEKKHLSREGWWFWGRVCGVFVLSGWRRRRPGRGQICFHRLAQWGATWRG